MSKSNRAKYLKSCLNKGKYYKQGSGFITMDDATKQSYTTELKKLAEGGNIEEADNTYSDAEQSYADYMKEVDTFGEEELEDYNTELDEYGEGLDNTATTNVGGAALSGAQQGMALGSTFGPIGTAIGAVAGGAMGGITGKFDKDFEEAQLAKEKSKIAGKKAKRELELKERKAEMQKDAYEKLEEVHNSEGTGNVSYFGAKGGRMFPDGGGINDSVEGDPPAQTMTQEQLDDLRIEKINARFGEGNKAQQAYYASDKYNPEGLATFGYKGKLTPGGKYTTNPTFAKNEEEMKTGIVRHTSEEAFKDIPTLSGMADFVQNENAPVRGYQKYTDESGREVAIPEFGFNNTAPKKYHKDVVEGTRQVPKYKDYDTSKRNLKSGKTVWRGGKKPKVIGTQDEKYYYYADKSGKEHEVNENRYQDELRKKELYGQNLNKYNQRKADFIKDYSSFLTTDETAELEALQGNLAYGGKLRDKNLDVVKGGQSKTLASNVEKIEGDTHEEGGVILANQNGKQVAEVEGEEVIKDGNDVYSERLGYADEAEKIGKKKAKYEEKLNSSNKFERATAERMVERLEKDLEDLFAQQEAQKGEQVPTNAYGGELAEGGKVNWGNVAGTALNVAGQVGQLAIPLLDNLYNKKQIDKIPEIPLPEFQKAREFDTEYNINPQLQEVDSSIKAYNTGVSRSSIQPQVTRANQLMANLKGMREKNVLRGNKENIESRLFNQSQINKQGVDAQNIAKREAFRMNKYLRTNEILGKESANVANAVEDVQLGIRDMNQRALDNRRITLDAAKYPDTGVSGQLLNDKKYVNSLRLNKNNQNQMKETIISSGRKDYIEQWNTLFPNNKISSKVETKDIPKDKDKVKWANPEGVNDFEGTYIS